MPLNPLTPALRGDIGTPELRVEYVCSAKWEDSHFNPLGEDTFISPYAVHFSCIISVLTQDTFLIQALNWADVSLEYIEIVKGDLGVSL